MLTLDNARAIHRHLIGIARELEKAYPAIRGADANGKTGKGCQARERRSREGTLINCQLPEEHAGEHISE